MKVEIWSDFVSPLCYIAKRKFELALEKFEQHDYVKVEYKSFLLHAKDRVKSEESKQLLIETCNIPVGKIEEWLEQVTNQASELNLPLEINHFIKTNTLDAHRLVKFAEKKGKELELINRLFEHFFSLKDKAKENINEKTTLIRLAKRCGLDETEVENFLSKGKYRRAVEYDEDVALELGIENVPFFVFNEKYALVGNQPIDLFLEALEESWKEDEERWLKKQRTKSKTTYCVGDDCNV